MPSASIEYLYLAQIVLAIFLGGVLGVQRERSGKSAGPRTYALVTAGAAMASMIALDIGSPVIIGHIIAGIGFLGVGTILHREGSAHIEGLTTAAGLWMTAMIGIAVGTSHFILSIGSTILILLLLMVNDQRFKGTKIH